ncbi:MAG: hypothetical protein U0Q16_27855 [Bryobacteraceae bacterium]
MASHSTQVRVLTSVLRLERFTVNDLCADSGLAPSQVYRPLADLENEGCVSSAAAARDDKRPANRPPKLYSVTADPEKADALRRRLLALLPPGVDPLREQSPRQPRAEQLLQELAAKVLPALENGIEGELDAWEKDAVGLAGRVKREVRLAMVEDGDEERLRAIASQASSLDRRIASFVEAERKRQRGEWFWRRLAALRPAYSTAEQVQAAAARLWLPKGVQALSFAVPAFAPAGRNEWPYSLGTAVLRTCPSAAVARDLWDQVLAAGGAGSRRPTLLFNAANLAYLAHAKEVAYLNWTESVAGLVAMYPPDPAVRVAVAAIAKDRWDPAQIAKLAAGNAGVRVGCVSRDPLAGVVGFGRQCEASLFDPGKRPGTVALAPGLATPYERLWLYGAAEEWQLPGIGPLAIPSLLVSWGFSPEQSWKIGEAFANDHVIVAFYFNSSAGQVERTERRFEKALDSELLLCRGGKRR